jgi:hypothetical protein
MSKSPMGTGRVVRLHEVVGGTARKPGEGTDWKQGSRADPAEWHPAARADSVRVQRKAVRTPVRHPATSTVSGSGRNVPRSSTPGATSLDGAELR